MGGDLGRDEGADAGTISGFCLHGIGKDWFALLLELRPLKSVGASEDRWTNDETLFFFFWRRVFRSTSAPLVYREAPR